MNSNHFEFTKLQLKEYSRLQERESNESKYWRNFNNNREVALQSAVNYIDFNPLNNGQYIVTSSLKVHLFNGHDDKIQRSYSRFTDEAFSGKYRKDGKLIVAGEKSGTIKVFDVGTKSLLRQARQHTGAVKTTKWTATGQNIVSGGDDKKLIVWDLATGEPIWSNKTNHTDYIRALDTHPEENDIFVSTSYDNTITFWDTRQTVPVWNVNHGHPVEYCMFAPSGSIFITAGGNEVKLWDVLSGGRLLHSFNNHQKNVTSLAIDGSQSRLLSSGLDGHLKVYSLQTLSVIHGMKFDSPLTYVNINQNNKKLVVGFNGSLLVKNNKKSAAIESVVDTAEGGEDVDLITYMDEQFTKSRFHKGVGTVHHSVGGGLGSNQSGQKGDNIVLESERQKKLQPYEKNLQKFNYQLALDTALETKNVIIIVTVLEELGRRNGLTIALSGRNEVTLEPLLVFLSQYINHSRYSHFLIQIAHRILDIYHGIIGFSPTIDELFKKLLDSINFELNFQKDIMRVMGSLDCIVNVATMPKRQKLTHSSSEAETNGNGLIALSDS